MGCVLLKLLSSIKVLQDKDYLIDHVCIYKKNTCVANHTTKKNIKDKGMWYIIKQTHILLFFYVFGLTFNSIKIKSKSLRPM